MMTRPTPIQFTDDARTKLGELIAARPNTLGVRFGLNGKGCSGFSYVLEFVDQAEPDDEVHQIDGIMVVIDGKSLLYLIGTTIDYHTDQFGSGFRFASPLATAMCGCGKSVSF